MFAESDWCVVLPAPYVKVYLMDNGKCVLKRRTRLARKTLDPLYQQQLQFEENPEGKVLQVRVRSSHARCAGSILWLKSAVMSLCPCRSSSGATTAAWTTNPSWARLRSYWMTWTCPTWLSAGLNSFLPPHWWTLPWPH